MTKKVFLIFSTVLVLGYFVGNFYPIFGHEMPHIVEYVEVPVEEETIIEVLQYHEDYTILLENRPVTELGGHLLFKSYYGLCDNTYNSIVYENESWYYEASYTGCSDEYLYYILIDNIYVTIQYAIDNSFITIADLEQSGIAKKTKK